MTREYGVRYGTEKRTFVAGGFTPDAAERWVAEHRDPKRWYPPAVEVVTRECGDWTPLSPSVTPEAGDSR